MIDVLLRPEAEADIEDIADYTIERWAADQARAYVTALLGDIQSLGLFPRRHPAYEILVLTFRKMISAEHVVFYLVSDTAVEIVRVFHKSRDFDRHLQ